MYSKLIVHIIVMNLGIGILHAQPVLTDTVSTEKKGIVNRFLNYLENSNQTNPDKKFDFSIIGGPHYSNETKVGLGLVASGLYRVDRNDLDMSPSNVSLYSDITTSGAYMVGISGNTLFLGLKYRIDADVYFAHRPSRYWGIGYAAGRENHYSEYDSQTIEVKFDFLKRMTENIYLGVTTSMKNIRGLHFEDIDFLQGERLRTFAAGAGVIVSYDSRDFIPNPYKGVYAKAEFIFYPEFLGSTFQFNQTELIARYYQRVWKGGVLAFDVQSIFNYGDVAWNMMALSGSSRQQRGYYKGRYRDKNLIQTQIELRQHIYKRNGLVAWLGAGNVFPEYSAFDWQNVLPTCGVGYRWEFKNRVNVRLDYGIGKGESAFYFNINEAF